MISIFMSVWIQQLSIKYICHLKFFLFCHKFKSSLIHNLSDKCSQLLSPTDQISDMQYKNVMVSDCIITWLVVFIHLAYCYFYWLSVSQLLFFCFTLAAVLLLHCDADEAQLIRAGMKAIPERGKKRINLPGWHKSVKTKTHFPPSRAPSLRLHQVVFWGEKLEWKITVNVGQGGCWQNWDTSKIHFYYRINCL